MQYLVEMKLAASSRPSGGAEEGIAFIEQLILPSLEACETLLEEKKILAGGPAVGAIRLLFIVSADSAQELDELVSSLPIWPRMETTMVPLTTFGGRATSLRPKLEGLKAMVQKQSASA
jgi:muconolactone delta-isomerase